MTERCETCRFHVNEECRRYPPSRTAEIRWMWPVTFEDHWCGEWTPRETPKERA